MRTLCSLLLLSLSVRAQTPYLVKDINTTYSMSIASSTPGQYTAWRDKVFFVATLEASGTELWSTDGTSAGTSLVADILPGAASSNPAAPIVVNDTLLFTARDVDHGIELWTTDGTAAGTHLLVDVSPGPNSAQPVWQTIDENRMLFSADDGINGRELWITDGTAGGTRMVKDLEPGSASSSPRSFVPFGDRLYFQTATGLWKTDGTEAGTVKVAATPGRNLSVAGSQLFFEGFTAETNYELWVSDGTEAGTRMLPEILPGLAGAFAASFSPQGFIRFGDRVLFIATDGVHGRELWISDGTAAGTRMVRDFLPGSEGRWDRSYVYLGVLGNRAYFFAEDAHHGHELWVTDGTDAGTSLFIDLVPGVDSSYPGAFYVAGGKLFFTAGPNYAGSPRLWVTDGTTGGTRSLSASDGTPFAMGTSVVRAAGGKLYFGGTTRLKGTEPWMSDGTDAGTRMIANLAPDGAPSSAPRMFAATNDLVFFHATAGDLASSNIAEASMWRSDGTEAGTFKLRATGQHPPSLMGAGPYVLYKDHPANPTWLMSDGTVQGTTTADKFVSRYNGNKIEAFFPFGNTLFARAASDDALWITKAAANAPATRLGAVNPSGLIEVAGSYMFYASSSNWDLGLWITDGTPAGTHAVIPDLGSDVYGVSNLANAAGTVFFISTKRDENPKLWKTDGTMDGTTVVKEVVSPIRALTAAGRRVFFLASDGLWTSDGTEAGTIELTKVRNFPGIEYDHLKVVGNRIVFPQYDSTDGHHELWGSDGTAAGTKLLAQLRYGAELASIEGRVYFAGHDDEHGTEIWTTDGTIEGTKLFIDLNSGAAGSTPFEFTKVRNTLFFSAQTEAVGQELWALPLTEPRLTGKDARAAEGAVARFNVALAAAATQAVTVDYATSDGTAQAGQDYEAVAGSLTFSPGETTKTIDVRLLADVFPENNETFHLALRNANGARLVNTEVAGIVDDDDQSADLNVTAEFSGGSTDLSTGVRVSNLGPRSATDVEVEFTSVPGEVGSQCWNCRIPQIAGGASAMAAGASSWAANQVYRSAVVSARQSDPNPSDNAASWIVSGDRRMAMNAAYLTPGATATVTVKTDSYSLPHPDPHSSHPAVVSISSSVTTGEKDTATFTVTAHAAGTSTIVVGGFRRPLLVTVVEPGTTPRWPDGLQFATDFTARRVHEPVTLTVTPIATAPLTGARATGTVTVTSAGQELAFGNLTGADSVKIPLYFRSLGSNSYQINYSGDANFLPQTLTQSVYLYKGQVAITGRLERVTGSPDTFALRVRVTGAPGVVPTGTIAIYHNANHKTSISLSPLDNETSVAEATITGLPASPTLSVSYAGDSLWEAASLELRLPESRRRSVRP